VPQGIEQTFASIHHEAISEVLHLLDGFYENLEHGLFELAYNLSDQSIQGRCAEVMKDLRLQKAKTIGRFTKVMEADQSVWLDSSNSRGPSEDLLVTGRNLALKHENHFATVLRAITRSTALATGRDEEAVEIPISPERIACHFLQCVNVGRESPEFSSMLHDLFGRLVLSRLGSLYGQINLRLIRDVEGLRSRATQVA